MKVKAFVCFPTKGAVHECKISDTRTVISFFTYRRQMTIAINRNPNNFIILKKQFFRM